jgi:RimJ/RimL family protein N-acetyltransferase
MNYLALQQSTFTHKEFKLIPIRYEDIFLIKTWRNNQIDVLRQKHVLTDEHQIKYYNNAILPLFSDKNPQQLLFSFLKDDICIGYGGLVHISWEDLRGEVSFLLAPELVKNDLVYGAYFSTFLTIIKEIAFNELNFNRIYTETYDIRDFHISVLEKNDFKLEGRLRKHIIINNNTVDSLFHGYLKEDYIK